MEDEYKKHNIEHMIHNVKMYYTVKLSFIKLIIMLVKAEH